MSIEGLSTLAQVLVGEQMSSTSGEMRTAQGGHIANVITTPTPEVDVSNRTLATFSDMVNPKQGSEALNDEGDSHPFYFMVGEEEEGEEGSSQHGYHDFEEERQLDEDEYYEEVDFVIPDGKDSGVFLNLHG
jgi:hypothetical protein